jgi:hypothetical protein
MSALTASETRSPLSASREIRACSAGLPSPAATEQGSDFVAVQADRVRARAGAGDHLLGGGGAGEPADGVAGQAQHGQIWAGPPPRPRLQAGRDRSHDGERWRKSVAVDHDLVSR